MKKFAKVFIVLALLAPAVVACSDNLTPETSKKTENKTTTNPNTLDYEEGMVTEDEIPL